MFTGWCDDIIFYYAINKLQRVIIFNALVALISSPHCINDGNNEKLASIDVCLNYALKIPYLITIKCQRYNFSHRQTLWVYDMIFKNYRMQYTQYSILDKQH